jgi:hypothetical protein
MLSTGLFRGLKKTYNGMIVSGPASIEFSDIAEELQRDGNDFSFPEHNMRGVVNREMYKMYRLKNGTVSRTIVWRWLKYCGHKYEK